MQYKGPPQLENIWLTWAISRNSGNRIGFNTGANLFLKYA